MTEKQKEKVIELTEKERNKFLEDLVFVGHTTYTKKLLNDKLTVSFQSLTGKDQVEIDTKMLEIKGSANKIMHVYTFWLLAYSLTDYNDKKLSNGDVEKRYEFISNLSNVVIDAISAAYNEFQEKLQACTKGDKIEETFFETPSTSSE